MEDSNRNIHEIMKAYPAITHSGISLNDMNVFFQSRGYYCSIQNISEEDIVRGSQENAYIVLTPFEKHISHLVVKKRISDNQLQVINFPSVVTKTKGKDKINAIEYRSLIVSKQPLSFFPKNEFIFAISTLLSILIVFAIFRRLKLRRKQTIKSF